MSSNVPRIAVIGGLSVDKKRLSRMFLSSAEEDSKLKTPPPLYTLGGAGGNFVIALGLIDRAYDSHTHVDFFTRVGHPPPNDLHAKIAHQLATEILAENEGITHIETSRGECAIAFNDIVEHPGGRFALTDELTNTGDLAYGIEESIHTVINGTDLVFVDPRKHRTGPMGVDAAKQHGKLLMTDWGEKEWPDNPELANAYDKILRNADVVTLPTDAVVKGMAPNVVNPDELFKRLRYEYGAQNILMSNGGDHARALINGQEEQIPVLRHQGDKYANGAGDTRNAGVIWALLRGHDTRSAFKFGTDVASVKIRYPRLEWADHLANDLRDHPLFRSSGTESFPGLSLQAGN